MISTQEPKCNTPIALNFSAKDICSETGRSFSSKFDFCRKLSRGTPPSDVDIVIVGAGIHGCGILAQLVADPAIGSKKIALIGDDEQLCGKFLHSIKDTGQAVLRSPYEHQLAPDGLIQMIDFARLYWDCLSSREQNQVKISLESARSLVPIDVFQGHVNYVCAALQLRRFAYRGRVTGISHLERTNHFIVFLSDSIQVRAKKVVLASGAVPRKQHADVNLVNEKEIAVIGAGLSAAQFVIDTANEGLTVYWNPKSKIEFQCSDVPHMYFRHEGITSFQAQSIAERKKTLRRASQSTIIPELRENLVNLIAGKKLQFVSGKDIEVFTKKGMKLKSFDGYLPDCSLLNYLNLDLTKFSDKTLECDFMPGLFVTGWLAQNNLGPAAKNIDGVRICYERIRAPLLELPDAKRVNVTPFPKSYIKGTLANTTSR